MCHSDDRTLRFDWKKVDRSLSQPMKVALCALFFDGDLYLEKTGDGLVFESPAQTKFGVATVSALRSRSLAVPGARHNYKHVSFAQMTLSPLGRQRMDAAKEAPLGGHG